MSAGRRPHSERQTPTRGTAGFTLIELMVVVLVMGAVLLLIPANMEGLGARGKFVGTANSLVAAFTGARERAILDAYEVALQLGTFRNEDGDYEHGWRFRFTNIPAQQISDDEAQQQDQREARQQQREWLYTDWKPCQPGIKIAGVSERRQVWKKLNEGGKAHEIRFFSDGTVETGVAVRLESEDLDVDKQYRTITVFVNGLTSEASWSEGELELPESLPASQLGN